MCSDPTHTKEFKDIAILMARMETKLDTVLSGLNDHETRLRIAEAAAVAHSTHDPEIDKMQVDIETLVKSNTGIIQTIETWRKILWAIGISAFGGMGLWLWRLVEDALKNRMGGI